MATARKVYIIGIGEDGPAGLTGNARRLVDEADLLVGEAHTLDLVEHAGERLVVGTSLDEAAERIEQSPDKNIVVLADGDPLFYGIARYLCDKLGKERFEVVPHVSTMQLAFARIKESWEEAFLTNLAGHPLESVLEQIRGAAKVGLFTTDEYPPSRVAQVLLSCQIENFTGYVCENLGAPDERVTHAELAELASHQFRPLNVMILVRKPFVPDRPTEAYGRRLFGNPDEAFLQSKPKRGLLTPSEIRAMVMAEMDLGPASVVWDVGAGSGSVAVEAAQIASQGTVYAIEKDPEDHELILQNAKRFGVGNLRAVLGHAPEALGDLPDPDAVFIGGTGREIARLVDAAYQRLKGGGRLVLTMSSVEHLAEIHRLLQQRCPSVKVWMVNLARGNYQLGRIRFEAMNPTFVMAVVKP